MQLARTGTIMLLSLLFVALVIATVGLTGCAADDPAPDPAPAPEPAPEQEPAPEPESDQEAEATDADRVLVESKCSGCHTLDRVWDRTQDRSGWESTVSRMEAQGLSVTDEERERIIDYLAAR